MGTSTVKKVVTAREGCSYGTPASRRHRGLPGRRSMGRSAPPRSTPRIVPTVGVAVGAFAARHEVELELDPGFDDLDGLDGQVDAIFSLSRREAVGTRFADDGDAA
ncbi:hypothetical protein [Methylobacterium aerolatum]|uniref:Uncharacterized protein n=1 Tax=Methylobacterium aerolatum TaxID=418708 RepID=A0ABU0HYX1_9HYPH|nr:hypothetical protein [Methylobacterium aerolatum]MDQ0447057.1 hypothetical protein [Methylobacterium aerolatum]GJD37218.1 hypothetical protein FMGBMHLM_4145 [Methylobacterium aerolatum]